MGCRLLCAHSFSVCEVMSLFFFFFFSSRRRHTRFDCDWSSDVCSSDLCCLETGCFRRREQGPLLSGSDGRSPRLLQFDAERSEERRVGKSVDLGGRRIIKKKKVKRDKANKRAKKSSFSDIE